jgi:hypothetical protein
LEELFRRWVRLHFAMQPIDTNMLSRFLSMDPDTALRDYNTHVADGMQRLLSVRYRPAHSEQPYTIPGRAILAIRHLVPQMFRPKAYTKILRIYNLPMCKKNRYVCAVTDKNCSTNRLLSDSSRFLSKFDDIIPKLLSNKFMHVITIAIMSCYSQQLNSCQFIFGRRQP